MDLKYHQYIIKANRESFCDETGNKINVGDQIMYLKGVRGLSKATVYCMESKFYKENENSIRTGWKV